MSFLVRDNKKRWKKIDFGRFFLQRQCFRMVTEALREINGGGMRMKNKLFLDQNQFIFRPKSN